MAIAVIVPNPDNVPGAVTTGYQRQNENLLMGNAGYANVFIFNGNTISEGSVFELNGNLCKVMEHAPIGGMAAANINVMQYVVARPGSTNAAVTFDLIPGPNIAMGETLDTWQAHWDSLKGGWYIRNTNNRVLMQCFIRQGAGGQRELVIARAMVGGLALAPIPPNAGGTLIASRNTKGAQTVNCPPGWVRYEMASGAGGNVSAPGGGDAISTGISAIDQFPGIGAGGQVASVSNQVTGTFYHPGGIIAISVGGNGFNGGRGAGGILGSGPLTAHPGSGGGGGGGAGAGEESTIASGDQKFSTERVNPGSGGEGGEGRSVTTTGVGGIPGGDGGGGIFENIRVLNNSTPIGGTAAIAEGSNLDILLPLENGEDGGINGGTTSVGRGFGGRGNTSIPNQNQLNFITGAFVSPTTIGTMLINGGTPGNGWGGGGGGGGSAASRPVGNTPPVGGGGGGGGAPGWLRPINSAAAGFINLFYLGA